MTKVLIVDDHPLFREGAALLMMQFDTSVEPMFAGSISQALEHAATQSPSLIMLDLGLPDSVDFSGLEQIRDAYPDIPVVMLSGEESAVLILGCLDRGAMGFISKSSSSAVFRAALQLVFSGGIYVPAAAMAVLSPAAAHPACNEGALPRFSPRERQVLEALIEGLSNKSIARHLNIAEQTAKFHVSNILKQLKVQNRTQAVIAAAHLGIRLSRPGDRGRLKTQAS